MTKRPALAGRFLLGWSGRIRPKPTSGLSRGLAVLLLAGNSERPAASSLGRADP